MLREKKQLTWRFYRDPLLEPLEPTSPRATRKFVCGNRGTYWRGKKLDWWLMTLDIIWSSKYLLRSCEYTFSNNHGNGKWLYLKGNYYWSDRILHFHDYGRKGRFLYPFKAEASGFIWRTFGSSITGGGNYAITTFKSGKRLQPVSGISIPKVTTFETCVAISQMYLETWWLLLRYQLWRDVL